jgi:hypothetical protein
VCNCYRAPQYSIVDYGNDISSIVEKALPEFQDIFIMGDMNAPHSIFWDQDTTNTEGRALHSIMDQAGLTQLIHTPTRIVNSTKSCIDLIFTTNPNIVTATGVRQKITDACDHCPIFATLKYSIPRPKAYKRWVWDFKRGSYENLRQCVLQAEWNSCFVDRDVNATVENWMSLLEKCAEAYIPHYEATIRPRDKDFMNSSIRRLMTTRDRLHKTYKLTGDENTGTEYRRCRNEVLSSIRQSKKIQEDKLDAKVSNMNTSSRTWWKVCKETLGPNTQNLHGPLLSGDMLISDDQEKANLLNCFFASQSVLDSSTSYLPDQPPSEPLVSIEPLVVQPEEVYKILVNLDPNKSTGPDGIGNRILKEAALPISKPMAELFNFCLSLGTFPEQWKLAQVIPIFKKGDPLQCTNYRPISLLPCISKVFERVLFNHIFHFLKTNDLINKHQSGFIPGDSTVNQLLAICHKLCGHLDNNEDVIGVFLDLTKAFDKVWHQGLLYKINKIGIQGNILKMMSSYLANRQQFVVLHGCKSNLAKLAAGVPQGSVLGPLLFLVYINDITEALANESYLFADDTSVFCPVQNGNILRTAEIINTDLDKLNKWAKKWLVTINPTKTVVMLFSKKRHPPLLPHLVLDGNQLQVVTMHKHLGIVLTQSLNWSEHINSVASKCSRLLSIFKRYKYRWSRLALETCYKSFVRPILEYGSIIYDSCTIGQSKQIESLQSEAARLVTGTKKGTSITSIIQELGWESLQSRRSQAKLIKMFEIVNKLAPKFLTELIIKFQPSEVHFTRSHTQCNYNIPKCKTTLLQKSFLVSGISGWNKLNESTKVAKSKAAFKKRLTKSFSVKTIANLFPHNTSRPNQVIFAQLRSGFSDLNGHLLLKGCVKNGACKCGFPTEDTKHYLLDCNLYDLTRQNMFLKLRLKVPVKVPTAKLLLFGSSDLSAEENVHIFELVCDFIKHSGRF